MGEEASEETRARVGQVVGGRYRIEGVLGEGGFGAVYRATDAEDGRVVALKCLHAHLAGHKEILTRFRREALAADAIGHPNIVAVLDSGLEPPDPWIALELLEGRDAGQLLRDGGPLSVAHAVHIVGQVCDALDAAHAKGIVHRDLKLDNVFLVGEPGQERVKLLDFGVSKFLDAIDGASLMTRTGTTIGTPFYMSPEQAQGKKSVGPPADVYALGVILFKLLTGQHPFEDGSYPMLVLKICTEPPPPITRYRADVPPAFEAVVERMLAKAAEARYPSCAAVKAALAPFAEMDGPPRLTDAAPTSARRASALGGSVMESAPTALSVDPHTGEPLLPDLEEEAAKTERAMSSGGGKWIGIGVLVLALVGAGVWWATQVGPESGGGGEVEAPSLPTPQPPRIAPLQVPEGAELGWRWVNPLPRAMPTWNDVAVGGPGLVAMVGREGRGGRMVGGALSSWGTGTEADLHALAWIGPAQVIAVGDGGAVQLMLQSGPRALETGVESDLRDVAALGTTDAIAVGDEGTILRLPGLQPTPLPSGHSEHLYGVHVEGEDTFAVGQRGLVLRVRGEEIVTERRPTGPSLRAVGGCGGAIYAVGDDGIVLRRASEGRWGRLDDTGDGDWTDVACDGGRVVASGSEGDVLVLAGDRSVRLSSGGERGLRGIGAAEGERTWVVGDGGLLATLEESRLRLLTAGHTGTLFDVGTLGGVLVAVGRWGAILREEDDRLKPAESPTDAALAALTLLSEDRLVAVGDHGAVVEITWDAARRVEGGGEAGWRDVVSGEGLLLAVGAGGALLRGAPGALSVSTVEGAGGLWGVAGTPADAIAVGDDGVVLRVRGAATERVEGCGEATLRGAWRDAESGAAWLVGDGGAIWRLDEEGCALEREGGPTLHAVGPGPEGRLLAVGGEGAGWERGEDGSWAEVELGTDFELQSLLRTDRDVYVVGAGGVVLRHPRLD